MFMFLFLFFIVLVRFDLLFGEWARNGGVNASEHVRTSSEVRGWGSSEVDGRQQFYQLLTRKHPPSARWNP